MHEPGLHLPAWYTRGSYTCTSQACTSQPGPCISQPGSYTFVWLVHAQSAIAIRVLASLADSIASWAGPALARMRPLLPCGP